MGFVHIREFFSYAWLKFLKRTPQWYVKELHLKDYFPENYSYLTAMSWHSLSDSGNLPSTEVKKEVTFCFRISKYLAKVWRTFLLVLSLEGKAVLLSFLFFSTFYFSVNTFYSSFHPSSLRVQYDICHTKMCSIFFWNKWVNKQVNQSLYFLKMILGSSVFSWAKSSLIPFHFILLVFLGVPPLF